MSKFNPDTGLSKLLACAGAFEVAYLSLYVFPASNKSLFIKYITTALVCFGLYLVALRISDALARATDAPGAQSLERNAVKIIVLFGLLFRLTLFVLPPFTSDDVFRYLWDGRVQHAGISPYAHAPTDDRLAFLRDHEVFPSVNHPQFKTIYPPAAQAVFFTAHAMAGNSLWGLKFLLLVSESAVFFLLFRLLKQTGESPLRVIAYAWCPLPILELFGGGHVDGFGLPWLVLFYLWMTTKRESRAAAALGAAALTKFLPLMLVPLALKSAALRSRVAFLGGLGAVVAVGYAPYLIWTGSGETFGNLSNYLQNWNFNGPLFWVLHQATENGLTARKLCAGVFLLWTAWVVVRERDFFRAATNTWIGFFLLNPTVYPWYLVWAAPLLVLHRPAALLWLMTASQLSYAVMIDWMDRRVWIESPWIYAIQFLPLIGFAVQSAVSRHKPSGNRVQ